LIAPYGFTIESPISLTHVFLSLAGWAGIAALLFIAARRFANARIGFWIWSAFVFLAPSSTFLPAADLSADRRMYLPMMAIGAIAGLLWRDRSRWVPLLILPLLALTSARQVRVWQSGEALWRQAVHFAPGQVRPYLQLARHTPPAEALRWLEQAARLAPEDPRIPMEKGRVLLESGSPEMALAEFGRALALNPADANAVNNRGVALLRLGQRDAAIADFRRALQLDACLPDARYNLRAAGISVEAPAHCKGKP
jgi:tetratricopeptide (TPR) repeat protein